MTLQGDKEESGRRVPICTSEAKDQAKLVSNPVWPPTSSVTSDKSLPPSRSEIFRARRRLRVCEALRAAPYKSTNSRSDSHGMRQAQSQRHCHPQVPKSKETGCETNWPLRITWLKSTALSSWHRRTVSATQVKSTRNRTEAPGAPQGSFPRM